MVAYLLRVSAEAWASIVTAGSTAVLAILTWRTVRAMTRQMTAPKRDKHLEWVQTSLLNPLKSYLSTVLAQTINDGLLPIEALPRSDRLGPKQLKPYENLPLLRSELIAHFKELSDTLDAFLRQYGNFTALAWDSIGKECSARYSEKLVGTPPESVLPFCYRSMFASTLHAKPRTLLSTEGEWHLRAEVEPLGFDLELGTKDAADELNAVLWRAMQNSKSELSNDFREMCLTWQQIGRAHV